MIHGFSSRRRGVATRARLASYKRYMIYLPIVGGVVVGVGVLFAQLATASLVNDFLSGPRRVEDASLTPDAFRVLDIRTRRGRLFTPQDDSASTPVMSGSATSPHSCGSATSPCKQPRLAR